MTHVFQLVKAIHSALIIVLALFAPLAYADTIVNFDFDEPGDLTSHFSPDNNPRLINESNGGIGNSGVINTTGLSNNGDVWTSKTGYSVNGAGDTYRLSAFFRTTDIRGHSGLGISTNEVNELIGSGNTESGIGYIATDSVITILSTESGNPSPDEYEFQLNAFEELFPNSWYHFEVTIITKEQSTFDVSIAISESTSSGDIGSVVTIISETGIVNNDIAQASKIHPYFSVNATSGSRFDRIDNLTMRLSGGPVVVSDPNADSDEDGQLDSVDDDDDNDGVGDDADTFPLDETENTDTDGDGIGDERDEDDDGDGTPDSEDAFSKDPSESIDSDGDGVGDNADEFPFDSSETKDTDGDGVGDNADAFPTDPDRTEGVITDRDGDGVDDVDDAFPDDENESLDSDGDSVGDNSDAFPDDPSETLDSDGDNVGDNADAFPNDPNETTDSDGDDVGDNADAFPDDPSETLDSDGDNVGDNSDAFPNDPNETADSDGDNVGDNADAFPNDPSETLDSDGDDVGDNADAFPDDASETADSDGDNVGDNADAFPDDENESVDSDGDNVGDNADAFPDDPSETLDSDGDNVGDNADAFPDDPSETVDSDGDNVGDNADAFPDDENESVDSDGDNVGDNADAFPFDEDETVDSDGDNVGDNADAFPFDENESADSDGDNVGDNADAFPDDPSETVDSDGDNVGDNSDAFPNDRFESVDSDGDNVGDNADAFPDDPEESADSDGDSVGDNADAFPNDPSETVDSDGDNVGDNADVFPDDPSETKDTDNDGLGDNSDPTPFGAIADFDNDGVVNELDAFPDNPNEWRDSDNDGVGDNEDAFDNDPSETSDLDGDGVGDNTDLFPKDPTEQTDLDLDGIGDNSDSDNDNDGTPDTDDAFPLNANEQVDSDADGVGNLADLDDDNDGYTDEVETRYDSDPLDARSLPEGLDIDRDSLADSLERGSDADGDGIGNEFDVDSDNDGIFDLIEASADPAKAAALDLNNDGMMDANQLRGLLRITVPVDTDGDSIRDYRDLDSDNDGITDTAETTQLSDDFILVNNLQNDQNSQVLADPDGDSLVNYRDLDSDNDGIPDIVEAGGEDKNNDGLADDFNDFNADGLDDSYFAFPLLPKDTDSDGIQDYLDLDSDNDNVFDIISSGFMNADINGDGRLDIASDADRNGVPDYVDVLVTEGVDSDGDGIDDRVDASILGEPDTDSDGIADRYDADILGNGFIKFATIKLEAESTPDLAAAQNTTAVATTSIGSGGCSVSGTGQPDMTLAALLIFSVVYLTLVRLGTMRTLKTTLLLFLSTSLAAGPTMADVQTGLYLGMGGGGSRLMPGIENAQLESRDSISPAWNATAGYQLSRTLGAEMEYSNLGSTMLEPLGSIDYQDINISGLYHLGGAATKDNGKRFSLYGKLGVGKISNQSNIQLEKENSTHMLLGLGVQMPLSDRFSLRAEGVTYSKDVSRAGLTLTYKLGKVKLPTFGLFSKRKDDDDVLEPKTVASNSASNYSENGPAESTSAQDNAPLFLSADQHPEYQVKAPDIEQLMAVEAAPAKRWVMSEDAIKRLYGKHEKPTMQAALPATDVKDSPNNAAEGLPAGATDPVRFNFDSNEIAPGYRKQLQPLVQYLSSTPDATVTLTGHTDNIGHEDYNQMLSLKRAEAVRKFLLQQGIDRKMIRILGAGEKRPLKSNANAAGRKANRRVSIVVN